MHAREMFGLTGKVALVTGGSRGLGLYMAQGLAELGAAVAITARSTEDLAAAKAQLETTGARVVAIPHDLANVDGTGDLLDAVVEALGDVDILVNNAALAIASPAEDHSAEDWNTVMRVNIDAMFFLTQAVAKRCMIPRRSGRILNISSTAGLGGSAIDSPLIISYNASKGAVISLTRGLATEWGKHGINVNCIVPGTFPSQMTAATLPQAHLRRVLSKTPLQRVGAEDDLKGVAAFLVSDAARHVTGQYIVVDGGAIVTNYPSTEAFEESA